MKKLVYNHPLPESLVEELAREYALTGPTGGEDFTDGELAEALKNADAYLCLRVRKFLPEWLENAPNLKVIGNAAVGYDNIDVPDARSHGVAVVNTPKAVCEATAEHAIALMLSVCRGIVRHHNELSGSLRCNVPFFYDRDILLYGKTLAIIGCGRVGKAVAKKAQGLGMEVVYYDPYRMREEDEAALGLRYLPFDEAIKAGDVVSIHMPYTKETHHLVNGKVFAAMKPAAYFINTARGPIVDEAAMEKALREHVIRGAAIDVFEFEPVVSPGLAALDNLVMVPHVGTLLLEVRRDMVMEAMSGVRAVLAGETPVNLVR